jgi:hypothetical protein
VNVLELIGRNLWKTCENLESLVECEANDAPSAAPVDAAFEFSWMRMARRASTKNLIAWMMLRVAEGSDSRDRALLDDELAAASALTSRFACVHRPSALDLDPRARELPHDRRRNNG